MRLEDEIKTKGFKNELHKLSINLIYTYNWMVGIMEDGFQQFGITMQQYNILRILRGQHPNPSTIQLLKSRMLDKQSDASRLIDRLSAKGLVDRKVCSVDRRKMDVVITKAGLSLLDKMEPSVSGSEELFHGLSMDEAKLVNDILDRIRDNKRPSEAGNPGD